MVERLQERCIQNHRLRGIEHAHLILQAVEIDTRLAAHTCIDHAQQGGRHVDVLNASLKRAGSKPTEVGHHAAAEVHHQGVTGAVSIAQLCPHFCQSVQCLVCICCTYNNRYSFF